MMPDPITTADMTSDAVETDKREPCPLSAIRVFCEVVRQNSFSRAAACLSVTPSAVSQRIKQLENHVGCQLIMRQRRDVILTEEGRFLYEKFDRSLGNIEYAVSCIVSGQITQRVTLGVLSSFTSKWLIPRLHRFYQKHPNLQLVTRSVNHTMDVERENVELAVVNLPSPPAAASLSSSLLWREKLFAVCSPHYIKKARQPLKSPADLCRHTLLHDQTEIANSRHLDWTSWMSVAAPGQAADLSAGRFFTQTDLALQAAIEGHGVALARSSLATDDLQKGRLIDPFKIKVPAQSGCYMCARKNIWEIPKIVMLRKWLSDEAAKDRRSLERGH